MLVLVLVEEVASDWLLPQRPDGGQSLQGDGEVGIHRAPGYKTKDTLLLEYMQNHTPY